MGFYPPAENPNVMRRENIKIFFIYCYLARYIYIASTTPEEILHTLEDKYKISIYHKTIIRMILVEQIFVNAKNILKSSMRM